MPPFPNAVAQYPRLRQSRLGSFDDCALLSHFEREATDHWSTHPQGRGKLFHAFAAKCLEEMSSQGEQTVEVDVALAILHEVLRQADVDTVCHTPGCELLAKLIPADERDDGRSLVCADGHKHHTEMANVPMRMIADLYWTAKKFAVDNTWDTANLVAVERRLEAQVYYPDPDGGSVARTITGQLDAMFLDAADPGHAIVVDFKDTWALPAPTEISFEGYFQQRFYAYLVMVNYPSIQRVTLKEFYVRRSESREASIGRAEHYDALGQEIAALAERFDRSVETETFPPSPGRHCNFCPRPTQCPIPVAVRGDGRIVDQEQAARLGAQLVVAEQVVKQTRKALQAYVDVHGPVPVKNSKGLTEWGYTQVERTRKPTVEDVNLATAQGRDPARLFKTSTGTRFGQIDVKPGQEREGEDLLGKLEESVARVKQAKLEKAATWTTGRE